MMTGVGIAASKNKKKRLRLDRLVSDPYMLLFGAERLNRASGRHAAGLDGMKFVDMTVMEIGHLIDRLSSDLRDGTYAPKRCMKKTVKKASGQTRTLRLPCVVDRLVQYTALYMLEPIMAADLSRVAMGGRRNCSVAGAVNMIADGLMSTPGPRHFLKVDIRSCFDALQHDRIEALLRQRLQGSVLVSALMKQLKCWSKKKGVPQGAPLSPLICNMYLSIIAQKFEARAQGCCLWVDDFLLIIPGGRHEAEAVLADLKKELALIGLELANEKTVITPVDEGVEFLGFKITQVNQEPVTIKCTEKHIEKKIIRIKEAKKNNIDLKSKEFKKLQAAIASWLSWVTILDHESAQSVALIFEDTFKTAPVRMSGYSKSRRDETEEDDESSLDLISSMYQTPTPPMDMSTAARGHESQDVPRAQVRGSTSGVGSGVNNRRVGVAHERSPAGRTCSPFGPAHLLEVADDELRDYSSVDV